MKVYVVWLEYNRGFDLEGGGSIEGVYATLAGAEEAAKENQENQQ